MTGGDQARRRRVAEAYAAFDCLLDTVATASQHFGGKRTDADRAAELGAVIEKAAEQARAEERDGP